MLTFLTKLSRRVERCYNAPVVEVEQNLALTPSDINKRNQQGLPISCAMLSPDSFDPGHEGTDPSVPFLARRGVDISEAAVYTQNSRRRISEAANATLSKKS